MKLGKMLQYGKNNILGTIATYDVPCADKLVATQLPQQKQRFIGNKKVLNLSKQNNNTTRVVTEQKQKKGTVKKNKLNNPYARQLVRKLPINRLLARPCQIMMNKTSTKLLLCTRTRKRQMGCSLQTKLKW